MSTADRGCGLPSDAFSARAVEVGAGDAWVLPNKLRAELKAGVRALQWQGRQGAGRAARLCQVRHSCLHRCSTGCQQAWLGMASSGARSGRAAR